MIALARRLQLLGAGALIAAPFLPWAWVPLFGIQLGIPGILLNGSILLVVGLLLLLQLAAGRAGGLFGWTGVIACAALSAHQYRLILTRTEYVLGKMQLSLADANHALASLNLPVIELFRRADDPGRYIGPGLPLVWLACLLLAVGMALESWGRARTGRSLWSVLLGWPRCAGCNSVLAESMKFCPGCGRSLSNTRVCAQCRTDVKIGYRYCPECGCGAEANASQ